MKIVVFGSTGSIGKEVVEQALEAGHDVTAVTRRPAAITIKHERLEVVKSDVQQFDTIAQALVGKGVVISSIGAPDRGPTSVYSQGIANIIQAMQDASVRRLICISASGLEPGNIIQHWIAKPLLWRLLKHMYTDLVLMETAVKRSNLDWTIVRPPRLTDGPRTGKYHVAINKPLTDGWVVSRANLAEYLLSQLANPEVYCATVEVAH